MRLLAVDPGPVESAWVVYDTDAGPRHWAKEPNHTFWTGLNFGYLLDATDEMAIEMVASYGMSVGAEVFETCVAIGRLVDRWERYRDGRAALFIYRRDVKMHLCGSMRAKDANVRQALIDRYGGKEAAIGRKHSPGPLYGMRGDCWSALAVAITASETMLDARAAA